MEVHNQHVHSKGILMSIKKRRRREGGGRTIPNIMIYCIVPTCIYRGKGFCPLKTKEIGGREEKANIMTTAQHSGQHKVLKIS